MRNMEPGSQWVAVIIEDDPDVRDLIDIVLTQSGFTTVVTENGTDGVEAVRKHNPLHHDARREHARAWTASRSPSGCASSAAPT